MAATNVHPVLGRQSEILDEFRRQIKAFQSGKKPANDVGVRGKERLLASLDGRVATAKAGREATVKRLDERVGALEKRAASLREEIERDRALLPPGRGPGKGPITPGSIIPGLSIGGRPPTQGPKTPSVGDIQGVGKAYRERLEAAGVSTPAEVAKMKPAALAEALGISESRAKAVVAAAKKVKK